MSSSTLESNIRLTSKSRIAPTLLVKNLNGKRKSTANLGEKSKWTMQYSKKEGQLPKKTNATTPADVASTAAKIKMLIEPTESQYADLHKCLEKVFNCSSIAASTAGPQNNPKKDPVK